MAAVLLVWIRYSSYDDLVSENLFAACIGSSSREWLVEFWDLGIPKHYLLSILECLQNFVSEARKMGGVKEKTTKPYIS